MRVGAAIAERVHACAADRPPRPEYRCSGCLNSEVMEIDYRTSETITVVRLRDEGSHTFGIRRNKSRIAWDDTILDD